MQWLKKLTEYCEEYTSPPDDLLRELERETHLKTLSPQMLSGHLQGMFLSWISSWIKPSAILEIGTFTGYGTICLARGLQESGVMHTIEVNPELSYISLKYFKKAGLSDKIRLYTGDAGHVVPTLDEVFDLAYIDAGKREYALHYEMVMDKMVPGGTILVDNVLWSGKVGTGLQDRDTHAIESFNKMVHEDTRVTHLLLPVRDGVMMIRKN